MNQIEKIIDIATWNRKEHFEHFSAFDDPFFGVTVNVDCTRAYREAKNKTPVMEATFSPYVDGIWRNLLVSALNTFSPPPSVPIHISFSFCS